MSLKLCVRWFTVLALAASALVSDAARADTSSWSAGCSDPPGATAGWIDLQPIMNIETRPFWMRPTPAYHSSWVRVPVTNYRPQVVNDPISGTTISALQPCDTYEWQIRRTPGSSLWQGLSTWWRSHLGCQSAALLTSATPACLPTGDRSEPAAAPYYELPSEAPGRLVPVPAGVSPSAPAPADQPPRLDPLPPRSSVDRADAESPMHDSQVFVHMLDERELELQLLPPLVADGSHGADLADDLQELSAPTASRQRGLPTNEVWDDRGWQSVR